MAIASIHLQRAKTHAFRHNDRTDKVTYLIDDSSENEVNRSHEEALKLLDLYIAQAQKTRAQNKQRALKNNIVKAVEAVVNLNADHTLEDVQRLCCAIERKYKFREVQIAVHRDEGRDKNHKNYHAHIVFCNIDKNGYTIQRSLTKTQLSELQTLVAHELGMTRGDPERKAKRLEHKEYKVVAKLKEMYDRKLKSTIDQAVSIVKKNQELERALKTNSKQQNEEYNFRALQQQITALSDVSVENKKALHAANNEISKLKKSNQEYEKKLLELIETIKNKDNQLEQSKQDNQSLIVQIASLQQELELTKLKAQASLNLNVELNKRSEELLEALEKAQAMLRSQQVTIDTQKKRIEEFERIEKEEEENPFATTTTTARTRYTTRLRF